MYESLPQSITEITQDVNQQLLMLHGRSFLGWGWERVAVGLTFKSSQYLMYGCLKHIAT